MNSIELPGMWDHSDFEGGDPDERGYAQRELEADLAHQPIPAMGTE